MSDLVGTAEWISPTVVAEQYPYAPGSFWLGREPTSGEALGYKDDRHILMACSNRAGKGTTTIINNLCTWPGSVVVVDPKGENATVTAARRGKGSEYCEGMGQAVYVLDPFGAADVDDEMRACFNPLDALDASQPGVIDEAGRLADAIVVVNRNAPEPIWDESARLLIKALILHVLTDPMFEGRRNLITVRNLILHGDREGVEFLKTLDDIGEIPSGRGLLLQGMVKNQAINGKIAGIATQILDMLIDTPKMLGSVWAVARSNTDFLDSPGMEACLAHSDFSIDELKTNPNGVSVYLSLPQRYMGEHFRWLRMMIGLTITEMEAVKGQPASGHRVLMCLDEFAGLERMKVIEDNIAQIAGFGLTLFIVLQSLKQLEAVYEKSWEVFISNCATKIFFSVDDQFSREYISKLIGDTQIMPEVQSSGTSQGHSESDTKGTSLSKTLGESVSHSEGRSSSRSDSVSTTNTLGGNRSVTEGENQSSTVGMSRSNTLGRSENSGWNESQTDGWNRNNSEGWNESESDGWSENETIGENRGGNKSKSKSRGSSHNASWDMNPFFLRQTSRYIPFLRENETVNYGDNESSGETEGTSWGTNRSRSQGLTGSRSRGRSGNRSEGISGSRARGTSGSVGFNESETEGLNQSETLGRNRSETEGESWSASEGRSNTRTDGRSSTDTVSQSQSLTQGENSSQTTGTTNTNTTGIAQTVQKRPLVTTDEIGLMFARETGYAIVLIGGGRPAVVARTPYFADPFFAWLFDPHPDHEAPLKLVGPERFYLPGSDVEIMARVELLKAPGELVRRGEPLAQLRELVTEIDDFNETYLGRVERVSPASFGLPDPLPADLRLLVRAQVDGKVLETVDADSIHGLHRDDEAFAVLEVNRRELVVSAIEDVGDDLDRYGSFLLACRDREAAGRENYQAARANASALEIEHAEQALRELNAATKRDSSQLEKDDTEYATLRREASERAQEKFKESITSVWADSDTPYLFVALGAGLLILGLVVWGGTHKGMELGNAVILGLCIGFLGAWGIGYWLTEEVQIDMSIKHDRKKQAAWDRLSGTRQEELIDREIERRLPPDKSLEDLRENLRQLERSVTDADAKRVQLTNNLERARAYASEVAEGLPAGKTPPLLPAWSSAASTN